jgi:uncharacterized protein (TIGR03435 family)
VQFALTKSSWLAVAMLMALPMWGQPAEGPQFEVATVKPNPSPGGISVLIPANAKLLGRNVTLMRLIGFAYDLNEPRIAGPSWLVSDAFDIQAKGQVGAKDADIKLMTRALLAERFGLQFHREARTARVYLLVRGGGAVKMTPAEEPQRPNPKIPPGPHHTMGGDWTMEQLAAYLSKATSVPVIDKTGDARKFHCYLWWGNNQEADPNIFQAIKEQMGLRLEAGKGLVEFLVVDRVNRTPSEN